MNGQPSELDDLDAILEGMLGSVDAIVPIESGTTGASFRIEAAESKYAAKLFSRQPDVLLGPRAQFELLEQIVSLEIAPRPVAYDEAAAVLVTEYFSDARTVPSTELAEPDRIHQIASVLRHLHGSGAVVPGFDPAEHANRYFSRLGGVARMTAFDRRLGAELADLAGAFDSGGACVCHNDLTADNLLFGAAPKLIDFDYAVSSSPILDLASLTVMNSFTPADEEKLLSAYFADGEVPFSTREFARVQRLVRLLAHFWSLASHDAGADIVEQYRILDV